MPPDKQTQNKNDLDDLLNHLPSETPAPSSTQLFGDLFEIDSLTASLTQPESKHTVNVKANQEFPQRPFPSVNTFSIDLDPFSPTLTLQTASAKTNVSQNPFDDIFFTAPSRAESTKITTNPFADPFDLGDFSTQDPFSVFNTVHRMSSDEEQITKLNFEEVELAANADDARKEEEKPKDSSSEIPKKSNFKYDDSSSSSDDEDYDKLTKPSDSKRPSVDIIEIRDSFSEKPFDEAKQAKNRKDSEDDSEKDDDMDNAFSSFSGVKVKPVEDLPSMADELGGRLKFDDFDTNESSTDFNDQMDLALRKGDTNLETVDISKVKKEAIEVKSGFYNKREADEDEVLVENENNKRESESISNENDSKATLKESAQMAKNFNRGVKI